MDLPEDSPANQSLDQIIGAAKRARDLTGQILAFSRQTETERRMLRPQTIVKEAVKLLRGSIPSSIEIRTHVNQDCSLVKADPGQFHQVIMNLCTNAYQAMLDAMGSGEAGRREAVLDIGLDDVVLEGSKAGRHGLPEGRFVMLSVSDSGPGIEESIRDKVFDPYFTTKPKGKGTGLGLAIVHSIALAHGGAVELDSNLGEGSCFKVYLPALAAADHQEPLPSADAAHLQGRERVLLVEDEPAVADGMTRYLTRLGYTVSAFRSPVAALEEFRKAPGGFDILLSDYHMPRMTGVELITQVRLLRRDLPTILFSGFSDNISKNAARLAGVDEYLAKPFAMRDLASAIRGLLQTGSRA
jgi:CheY-like chemotaxis protein